MPEIIPFQAIYYGVNQHNLLTTQPYDRISQDQQEEYYKRHENNVIRLIKGKDLPTDNQVENKYTRARKFFTDWMRQGILRMDPAPALYTNYQTYNYRGQTKVRKGLSCMVKIHELGRSIHPHESTHIAPKEDRYKLLDITEAFFEHIFMLYSDEKKTVAKLMDDCIKGDPIAKAQDDFHETHTVQRIADKRVIEAIQKELLHKDLIIADGHHRYEATLRLKTEKKKVNYILATLFNIEEELTNLPTHRAVFGITVSLVHLLEQCSSEFTITRYGTDNDSVTEFIEDVRVEGLNKCAFGLVSDKWLYLLAAKQRQNELDVNILHNDILYKFLDISPDDLAKENKLHYYRSEEEVIKRTLNREYVVSFLVNPVKIAQIKSLVRQGKRFPQKTTDFYPKLLSGLLMAKFI